jgi:fumarate reductase subunit D
MLCAWMPARAHPAIAMAEQVIGNAVVFVRTVLPTLCGGRGTPRRQGQAAPAAGHGLT